MRKRILSKKIAATFLVAAMMAVTVDASSKSQTVEVGNVISANRNVPICIIV